MEDYSVADQEADIQREIEMSSPIFSTILSLSALESEYSNNPNFLRKLPGILSSYPFFRKTRGDGNCFYRCFMFSLLEQFIKHKNQLKTDSPSGLMYRNLIQKVKDSGNWLMAAGFEPICYEDFIDLICSKLESVDSSTEETLDSDFKDKMLADSIVMYSRFLTSAFLRMNQERFEGFTEGYATVVDFCKSEVEPMDRESEQLQVMAVAEVFGVRIKIIYLDRSDSDVCTELVFPVDYSGPDFTVHFLYRPGHYDLLYPAP